MRVRHPSSFDFPLQWLFSDERAKTGLLALAALLPPGSGIVLRHDRLARGARWRLLRRLMRTARARRLVVLLAGLPAEARRGGAHGVHLRHQHAARAKQARRLGLFVAMPVHSARETRRAHRAGADAVFVSPLHPTRSHPGAPVLGHAAWLRLARRWGTAAVALGGMTSKRARVLSHARGCRTGWAGIDIWEERAAKRRARQKRKAVPT
ncbi:thiamine phosphate synthase [Sphingopyxis sp. JAI128]|uniref:thiamine phosphate synthase n=1 Tax=Sphingopyxis sp. JAI128 TaxID=2723066 RepID=UPI00161E0A84|nr:thiamine phosphate synthase [Sphingopyxis sp. JAI128]MBB6426245.1 thiamine-phosphate pyrophosphorylase [Sphingopyxis sp. JAI128]